METVNNNISVSNDENENMCKKRERSDLSAIKSTLQNFFDRGMTAVKTSEQKELVEQCSAATGLRYEQIKNWIGNHKKKMAVVEPSEKPEAYGANKKSARNVFFSEEMRKMTGVPATQRFIIASQQWKLLQRNGEHQPYVEEARKRMTLQQASKVNADAARQYKQMLQKKMAKLIDEFDSVGCDVMVLSHDKTSQLITRFGTTRGLDFVRKRPDFEMKFMSFVGAENARNKHLKTLQDRVSHLFNKQCEKVTGLPVCSYEEVRQGRLTVTGLPDGLVFKHPSSMGSKTCMKILAAANGIQFSHPTTDANNAAEAVELEAVTVTEQQADDDSAFNSLTGQTSGNADLLTVNLDSRPDVSFVVNAEEYSITVVPRIDNSDTDVQSHTPLEATENGNMEPFGTGKRKRVQKVYTVEKILDERKNGRRKEYLVRWEGFGKEHDSWEPSRNFVEKTCITKWKESKA